MTGCGSPVQNQGLLGGRDAPGLFPALHSGGRFTDQIGHLANTAEAGENVCGVHGSWMYDNIAHLATSNSHRLCATFSRKGRVENVTEKLKMLRNRAVPKLSVRKMASELGVPPSTYAAYEDPAKFKKPILPLEMAKRFAEVLSKRGIPVAEVLRLAGVTGDLQISPEPSVDDSDEWLEIAGTVEGGVWRAQSEWPPSERYQVRFGKSKYTDGQRFGVRLEGLSMNLTILPGSDLECLWVKFSPFAPQPGDLVIVERRAHDLVELTCKRLAMDGDDYVLMAESSELEFQQAIHLGKPDNGFFADDEIAIVGIVLSAKKDLAPRGLSSRRYIR